VAGWQRVGADLVDVVATGSAGSHERLDGFDGIDVGDRLLAGSADTLDGGHSRHQARVRVPPKTAIKLPTCLGSMVKLPSSCFSPRPAVAARRIAPDRGAVPLGPTTARLTAGPRHCARERTRQRARPEADGRQARAITAAVALLGRVGVGGGADGSGVAALVSIAGDASRPLARHERTGATAEVFPGETSI